MLTSVALVATLVIAAPPATPVITEPGVDGQILNPSDVHMETAPFFDSDGDGHFCTDWEIWTAGFGQRVWSASCATGLEKVHAHFGDGVFEGALSGRTELDGDIAYVIRARHRDDSPSQQYSAWVQRPFTTGAASTIFPMELDDILDTPAPTWTTAANGLAVVLPGGATRPRLQIETSVGALLLSIEGFDGMNNMIVNPPPLADHTPVRVRIESGSASLTLAESDLSFLTDEGALETVYLPAVNVLAGGDVTYWIDASGATFFGTASQNQPDFSSIARSAPTPWVVFNPGYVIERVAGGFQLPVNIAFVPTPTAAPSDPLCYVTELYGTIKVIANDGTVSNYATGLLNFNTTGNFPGSGEQGLSGITVDTNGDVYASMLYDAGGPHYPKIVKFTSTDGGRTASTQTTILDMAGESQGQSHQISTLTIGPDGYLYQHMGDGFDTSTSQNLSSFRGKILRLDRNGNAVATNPFYNAGNGITARDYVFAYGVRNPFGGAWRPSDGSLYEVENGPSVDRVVKVVSGRNYLWDGSDASMFNFALYNWDPAHGPVNMAFVDPAIHGGSGFPADQMDKMFITESGPTYASGSQTRGKRIVRFELDGAGNLVSGPQTLIEYQGTGRATAVALAAGPDGLYFSDFYKDQGALTPIDRGSNVYRVRFKGSASFEVDVSSGVAPLTVNFTDTSTVPGASAWLWEFGDGTTSTLQHPTHVYSSDGAFDVQLTVTGLAGISVLQRTRLVRVGAIPRVAFIGSDVPPTASDQAIANFLTGLGYEVTAFDDDPGNRPLASALAANHELVVMSSTSVSGNVGDSFRFQPVGFLFWESAMLDGAREGLAADGEVLTGQTSIQITDAAHPITADFPIGPLTVFSSPSLTSVAIPPIGADARVLADSTGVFNRPTIIVAETGADLVGGQVAPARRTFLNLEDSSFLTATGSMEQIVANAACWTAGLTGPSVVTEPMDQVLLPGDTLVLTAGVQGSSPLSFRWRRNGQVLPNSGSASLTLPVTTPADSGMYELEITNPCGTAFSAGTMVTIRCPADFDGNGTVDSNDFFGFLDGFFAGSADFNSDGVTNSTDFFEFLDAFFAPCV